MNIPLGLLRLWTVFSALWTSCVAIGVFLLWPVEPNPPPAGFMIDRGMFDDLIPSIAEQRATVLFDAGGIALLGCGLLLLIGLASMWIAAGFRRKA